VQAMRQALSIDPATENGWVFVVVAQIELGQVDSALASARQGIAAGADRAMIGRALQLPVAAAAKQANEGKAREPWLDVVRLASNIDSIAPTAGVKYYLGGGAFHVGVDLLKSIYTTKSYA